MAKSKSKARKRARDHVKSDGISSGASDIKVKAAESSVNPPPAGNGVLPASDTSLSSGAVQAPKASAGTGILPAPGDDAAAIAPNGNTPSVAKSPAATTISSQPRKLTVHRGGVAGDNIFARAVAAHRAGRLDEAIALYGAILRNRPDQPDILNNLGVALRRSKQFDAAMVAYRRSAALRPDNAGLWSNMGNCLREMMRFDEARAAHEQSLARDTNDKSHLFNAGLVYRDLNRFAEAIDYFNKALAIDPDYTEALWDRSLAYLALGQYEAGWKAYEVRRRLADNPIRPLPDAVEWDGKADLRGKTLLLRAEQGFGDMIQFARFIPRVAKKAAHVIVECRKEMLGIMQTVPGVGQVIEKGAKPPKFDLHAPLLSLPYLLNIGARELFQASASPYMTPPHKMALGGIVGEVVLKVGIIWAGKLNPRDRSCPLEKFMGLMGQPGAAFFSFQIDDRRGDIAKLGASAFIHDLGDRIGDFGDSAALMAEMDLIITIDSAPAHLAGALGLPVWMLQLFTTDWRWMVGRADSPWYPTMRIYRQQQPNNWDAPFAALKQDFENLLAARAQAAQQAG
ncbi:tetratricopeptide repeat protein [Thalassospira profundimaris]|uniref:tetratricopeptide repeat-containing glycosyltransferase family protein n=1 Tax=Thalassospira profundimaris TaxID=502049 RepID=UPI000DEE040D|nr:tetratricopeptide repeat-containing glycosyltransferase family protein [Thalassospira profundimaris]